MGCLSSKKKIPAEAYSQLALGRDVEEKNIMRGSVRRSLLDRSHAVTVRFPGCIQTDPAFWHDANKATLPLDTSPKSDSLFVGGCPAPALHFACVSGPAGPCRNRVFRKQRGKTR